MDKKITIKKDLNYENNFGLEDWKVDTFIGRCYILEKALEKLGRDIIAVVVKEAEIIKGSKWIIQSK